MINLKSISKIFKSKSDDYLALNNITMHIRKGEYVLITGKSGSGKSTLLNMITGIDSPTAGAIHIAGNEIATMDERALTKWRGEAVGIVFQFFQLIPTLSVIENILLPMDLVGKIACEKRLCYAKDLLKLVDMERHADKMPVLLSGGEQQRVAIARALANDVDLIVADEPTGNLDSANSQMIYELLAKLHEAGKTIVMVTHDNDRIPGAERKIILRDGNIVDDYSLMGGAQA